MPLTELGFSPEQEHMSPEGVWIFPAQGDLKPGIGKDEYENPDGSDAFKAVIDQADAIIGGETKFSEIMFNDPEVTLSSPPNAHLALTIITIAKLNMAVEQGIITAPPTSIISNSAGEVAALYAAGVTDTLEDTLAIAKKRGELTQEASVGHDVLMTTLIAKNADANILGQARSIVDDLNRRENEAGGGDTVGISGINSPISIGLTGDRRLVEEAKGLLRDISRRQSDMDMIKIASHCQIMRPAATEFKRFLRSFVKSERLSDPQFAMNMNGVRVDTLDGVIERLEMGLVEPVDFVGSVKNITEFGQRPTLYELSTKQLDPVKGEINPVWGRFANDTLQKDDPQFSVVVI